MRSYRYFVIQIPEGQVDEGFVVRLKRQIPWLVEELGQAYASEVMGYMLDDTDAAEAWRARNRPEEALQIYHGRASSA